MAAKLLAIPNLFDDRFGGIHGLARLVLSRQVIMLELGDEDGIMYAEDVEPGGYAVAHIAIFHRRALPELDKQVKDAVKWLFGTFRPAYLAAWVPETNSPAMRLLQRLGWSFDGIIRGVLKYGGKRVAAVVYSLSAEEVANGKQETGT